MKKILGFCFVCSVLVLQAKAVEVDPKTVYRNVADVTLPTLKVPTVVELSSSDLSSQVAVFDDTTAQFVPSLVKSNIARVVPKEAEIVGVDNSPITEAVDGNFGTYFEFNLPEQGKGVVGLTLRYPKVMSVNSVSFSLASFVALPTKVSIKAHVGGQMKTIVSDIVPSSPTISFPEYKSDWFIIELEYGQPLRINEIKFNQVNAPATVETLRFLALPDHVYKVFSNPAYVVGLNLPESADLQDDRDVLKVPKVFASVANQLFKEPDADMDTIIDIQDNCVQTANTDQKDEDGNGRGDVCDDFDRDNIINSIDNCPESPNRNQIDTDRDGKGDVCDGQESRLTEKYPVLVWGAIVFAALVFGSLFYFVMRKSKEQPQQDA